MRPLLLSLATLALMACGSSATPPAPSPATPSLPAAPAAPATARLTVTASGSKITSTPAGIDCYSDGSPYNSTGACSVDFPRGTVVTLHWTALGVGGVPQLSVSEPGQDPASATNVSDDHCVVKMDGDRKVYAATLSVPPPPARSH